jgi:putative ABC transport system substrate-binding protein
VDVLVAGSGGAAQAAKRATTTLPIVMLVGVDPVEQGLVARRARLGGNLTGLSVMPMERTQKRLELLREAVPSLSRVAVLWGPVSPLRRRTLERDAFEGAARVLGVPLVPLEVHGADDLARTFPRATEERVDAVITAQHPVFHPDRAQIAALALQYRLPLMSGAVPLRMWIASCEAPSQRTCRWSYP